MGVEPKNCKAYHNFNLIYLILGPVEWSGCGWNGLGVGGMVWVWVEWSGCGWNGLGVELVGLMG